MMSDTQKDIERLADINDHLRRQLDKSNEIIVELNHMVAKQAGEIATLRQQVAEAERQWDNVRRDNAKLLRQLTENRHAYKRLHDVMEDVNRHKAELRQQVAELQATVAAVKRKAQRFGDIADDWQKLANEKPEDSPKSGGFARISSVYAVCAAELREVIGIE